MKVELFDFDLPKERIALTPANPRDSARLLIAGEHFSDRHVHELPHFLRAGDVMVFNDTRVIPAQLTGKRGEAKVEVTLHKKHSQTVWHAFVKPAKRLAVGDTVSFGAGFDARVIDKLETGEVVFEFLVPPEQMMPMLAAYGRMPLPPYITRHAARADDTQDYQTVYAAHDGAVAAPTAGLHFTPQLLAKLDTLGITRVYVTLHVGAGTFLPVKAEDTTQHVMHAEVTMLDAATAATINAAKAAGKRVVAVGTTSLRTLESATGDDGIVQAFAGETRLFITPGYRFKCVDVLMTNFHLPRSTLFMLVSAFSGLERMKKAYQHAIDAGYRFYSYGDACLIEKSDHDSI